MFINKNLRLNNSKTKTAMNAKISIFVICVQAIIHLLLHNLHDCTFKTYEHSFMFHIETYHLVSRVNYMKCCNAGLNES